jgi:uncharacterized RDD family membrane protein YckC
MKERNQMPVPMAPNYMETIKPFGSVLRRFMALLIDVIPITLAFFALFYFTTDFKDTVDRFLDENRTIEDRRQFLKERNRVRNVSGFAYLLYAAVLEASAMRGTIGKRIFGLQVVDMTG